MSLDSPISYPPTLSDFLIHWESVDEALPTPVVLRQGDRAAGLALEAELLAAVAAAQAAGVNLRLARGTAALGRTAVRSGLEDFHGMVRAYWEGTPWPGLLARLPAVGAALDKFLRPCRDGLRIWQVLEGEPSPPGAPVPLRAGPAPGLLRADYAALVEGLRLQGLALEEAEFSLALARARRNGVMRRVRTLLMSYARTLPTLLAADEPLLSSMPRLWPLPGHTPDPVRAAAEWLAERGVARVSWSESKDAALDHYELRGCPGEKYERAEEELLGKISPGAERVLETARLLETPGAAACFRVYVVLKTGNERASNPVPVARPE